MNFALRDLLEEVTREHFPYPPATLAEIDEFEQRVGWRLDAPMREFYLHCNGAELIERLPDAPYRVLPLSKIVRARAAIFGARNDDDAHGPASLWTLCDVQDGNYVLLDTAKQEKGCYLLVDGYHEAWPNPKYCGLVAYSFSEFLAEILRTKRQLYWLGE